MGAPTRGEEVLVNVEELRNAVRWCSIHKMPDCSPLLNGCSRPNNQVATLDKLIEGNRRQFSDSGYCYPCGGDTSHNDECPFQGEVP